MDAYFESLNKGSIYRADIELANSYSIQEFDPMSIVDSYGFISITAATGAGKTVLIKDLLSRIHKYYDSIYLISPTAKFQKMYNFIPKSNISEVFDEEFLNIIWNKSSNKKLSDQSCKLDKILIILDDIIHDPLFKKSTAMKQFATGSRHLNISMWILTQNFTSIPPIIRNNIRISIAFDLDGKKEKEKFVSSYLSSKNQRVGILLFERITKVKYQACIVEVYKSGEDVENKVKRYIANPKIKEFKVKEVKMCSSSKTPSGAFEMLDGLSVRTRKV